MHIRTKICGVTSPQIAEHAISAGADAIGLMFYEKSTRFVDFEQARAINQVAAPFVAQVGVVVNATESRLEEILKKVNLDYLQFHGDESEEFCRKIGFPYIRAIRVGKDTDLRLLEEEYASASAIMLDSHVENYFGGTGERFDWERARYGGRKPVILAGGLNPENVCEAITIARPYGVDVSSGVEREGQKDPDAIIRFCKNVQKCVC